MLDSDCFMPMRVIGGDDDFDEVAERAKLKARQVEMEKEMK